MAKKPKENKVKMAEEERTEAVEEAPLSASADIPPNSSQERANDLGGDDGEGEGAAHPADATHSDDVMVEVLPLRGIGGFGDAGHQGLMARELAEMYVVEGYVKILDEEDGNE